MAPIVNTMSDDSETGAIFQIHSLMMQKLSSHSQRGENFGTQEIHQDH